MPYIGKQPTIGEFVELDALTASATDEYTLTKNSVAYYPETVNNLLVSINGVIQAGSTMSLSGNTLTVGATLSSSDVIDFVRVFGNVGNVVTPTDGSVTSAKLDTNIAISGNLDVGTIRDASGTTTAMTIDSSGHILTPTRPAFHVYKTADQAVSGNSIVTWDAASVNIGNCFSLTDNEFTAPVTGLYFIQLTLRAENSTTITNEQISTYCYKNNVHFKQMTQILTAQNQLSNSHVSSSFVDVLTAGDVIHFQATIGGTGPSIGGESAGRQTYASGFLIG